MTRRHVPEAGQSINKLLAICVGQCRTVALNPNIRLSLKVRVVEGMNEVRDITITSGCITRSSGTGHIDNPFAWQNSTRVFARKALAEVSQADYTFSRGRALPSMSRSRASVDIDE